MDQAGDSSLVSNRSAAPAFHKHGAHPLSGHRHRSGETYSDEDSPRSFQPVRRQPPTVRAMKVFRAVLSVAAVVALAGCGATSGTGSASSPTPSSVAPTATPSAAVDVSAARAAALTIIVPLPNTSGVWGGCPQLAKNFAACPFAPALIARLNHLSSIGFFGDAPPGVCGEDYITGTQNGLFVAPQVESAIADANGDVMVDVRRGPPPPDLTVTMTFENGTWLATDLASGTGPSASIFSDKPNC